VNELQVLIQVIFSVEGTLFKCPFMAWLVVMDFKVRFIRVWHTTEHTTHAAGV
jgi:hypothetical protein